MSSSASSAKAFLLQVKSKQSLFCLNCGSMASMACMKSILGGDEMATNSWPQTVLVWPLLCFHGDELMLDWEIGIFPHPKQS